MEFVPSNAIKNQEVRYDGWIYKTYEGLQELVKIYNYVISAKSETKSDCEITILEMRSFNVNSQSGKVKFLAVKYILLQTCLST